MYQKYEIPFDHGIYLRSPGYEVGSMIWCINIELRWKIDEYIQNENKNYDQNNNINPIIDLRENDEKQNQSETETETKNR